MEELLPYTYKREKLLGESRMREDFGLFGTFFKEFRIKIGGLNKQFLISQL